MLKGGGALLRGLKYISWADNTGYAIGAKAYIKALVDAGVPLTWTPMLPDEAGYVERSDLSWLEDPLRSVCNRTIDYDTVLINATPESFPAVIERERATGRRVVGYTTWELDRLPSHWPDILNRLDGVIVPCRWNREVFSQSGVTVPIHVVPYFLESSAARKASEADKAAMLARIGLAGRVRPFIFYTIGHWSHRKAQYLMLEAYLRAFDSNDSVLLVIKTNEKDVTHWRRHWRNGFRRRHPSPVETVADRLRSCTSPAPVIVIADETLGDGEIDALHEIGDCFVSLTRSEGWGLGAFEAAGRGNPVVITGYGGQTDFLDSTNAMLVDFKLVPVHEPAYSSYSPTQQWAEPSISDAVRKMRDVFENRETARERARRQADSIARDFSRKAIVDSLLRAIA